MPQFSLFVRLLAGTFKLERGHLRFPTFKRMLSVLVFLPLYLLGTLNNLLFLGLDELLFPAYRKQSLEKAVFIVGMPRSATTFLFHKLAEDRAAFTCFPMWELSMAPSICQKYFFLGLRWVDRKVGSPLYRLSLLFDRWVFGQFRGIHDMGLTKPEEDEGLFLPVFAAGYLTFFFPDHPAFDPYLRFDRDLPAKTRRSLMQFYRRCLQRHNYVFNRDEARYFLSKNPTFAPKLASLAEAIPTAKLLYPHRSAYATIPATISLNAHIYSAFTRLPVESPLAERTREMILDWYEMADAALVGPWQNRFQLLPFEEIVKTPAQCLEEIYQFLELPVSAAHQQRFQAIAQAARQYKSPHQYDRTAGVDRAVIAERLAGLRYLGEQSA